MERNRILIAEDGRGVPDEPVTNLQIVGYETVLYGDCAAELSGQINYNKITFYRSHLLWSAFEL